MKLFSTALLAATLLSTPALAHVTANPDTGPAGQYFQTSLRISHGCDGSPTREVRVKLPKGLVSLRAQAKPGWTVTIKKRPLEKPVPAGHRKMASEEFAEVVWSGGTLPDDQYDEFGLLVKLPDLPHEILWLPVTQVCAKGENGWTEIPAPGQEWHDVKNPAPFIHIMDAPASSGHKH